MWFEPILSSNNGKSRSPLVFSYWTRPNLLGNLWFLGIRGLFYNKLEYRLDRPKHRIIPSYRVYRDIEDRIGRYGYI